MNQAFLVLGGLVLCGFGWRLFRSPRPDYPPLEIATDDPLMLEATRKAKASLSRFRELLSSNPQAGNVKFPFVSSSGVVEHVWAEVVEVVGNQVSVRLVTPPVSHGGLVESMHLKSLDEIEDWQLTLPDGRIEGGYSMRVMFVRGREQWGSLPPELEELRQKYGSA